MKICRIISLILILAFVLTAAAFSLTACGEEDGFVPVLRFAIASDVHVADYGSELEEERLERLFDMAYAYAKCSDTGYDALDAVIFAGDFTDLGTLNSMQRFKGIVDANIRTGTTAVVSLGNHEFYTEPETTEARYESVFCGEVDEHLVISGFHFIKLSPNGEYFSEEKLIWLRKELEKAASDTPELPIFVIQHQHVRNTVYGSEGWGVDGLYDILADYPQVVDFSGHSHFPIQDERSLWQGEFTAVGTGTLSYVEMGLNGVSTDYIFPDGKNGDYKYMARSGESDYSVFQILECDKNGNMRIIGCDLISGEKLFERRIGAPASLQGTGVNKTEIGVSIPEFKEGSKLSFAVDEVGSVLLTVPVACSESYIESYRAEVYAGAKTVGTYYALSGEIFNPHPTHIRIRLDGLEKKGEYTVRVYAVNSSGESSTKPLELEIVLNS